MVVGGVYREGKRCKRCSAVLPKTYEDELCPACQEAELFSEVKDYIRSNDVREMDVVDHFGIPIGLVRRWIREGRIQYKGSDGRTLSGVHCQICGKTIEFGTLCPECHRLQGLQIISQQYEDVKAAMRFLNSKKEKDVKQGENKTRRES